MHLTATALLPPGLSSLGLARELLDALLDLASAHEHCRTELGVVITEACANAVQHGENAMVEVAVVIDRDNCAIEVRNRGRTPTAGQVTAAPPAPDRVHGRGLPLIAALTDTATFVRAAAGQVVLRMTRRLPPLAPAGSAQPHRGHPPAPES
ncbi:ATP-binding protein [Dactylosporangium matsuzakiense]|uniref:Histidine kinase/HSP90-like ATPase domain-containing protein n=1 Tax=Dactylosporangium matsuzakiense TaxID=53360 RepID=A0A9W6KPY5_9ACTN|nr:ATP-binding protein [Dactylosporangium matsuzakiense]UWZ44166.1 ATP-binding protein [Dactylosporangium matsuzakiense]GLL03399.1 hypothetical protein GCM10017581_051440 [Dactylosporangium matsuzakiense]